MNKKEILSRFFILNSDIFDLWNDIFQENLGNKQFDYVTDPKLSDEVDKLIETAERIRKIVYQESK